MIGPHHETKQRQDAMHSQKGLSLVELIITLLIASVALMIAIPSFASLLRAQQLDSALTVVRSHFALTRHEAIRSGTSATMVKSGAQWEDGWTVFLDANGSGTQDAEEIALKVSEGLSSGLTLRGNSNVNSYIRYTPNGRATLTNGGYQMGTLHLCQTASGAGYQLRLNAGGRLSVLKLGDCLTLP